MSGSPKQKAVASMATIIAFTSLLIALNAFVVIQPGHVGVMAHFGAVQNEVLPEGLHFITPVRTKITPINVRVQKIEAAASASSKDLQVVTSKVALNFYLDKTQANIIFQELGADYAKTIIGPTIQESVKSTTAQYTAEELITKRPNVKKDIQKTVTMRLSQNHIICTDFSILDFSFSREFNRAIEEKQVAEQAALRAKNDLERIKTEAEQVKAKAKGDAEAKLELAKAEAQAQTLLSASLDAQIIQLRTIQKWDGVLPVSLGGGEGTFFDVVGAASSKIRKRPVMEAHKTNLRSGPRK